MVTVGPQVVGVRRNLLRLMYPTTGGGLFLCDSRLGQLTKWVIHISRKNTLSAQIVFIAGAIKSGSTLLDQAISTQNGVIGLGEVDHFADPAKLFHPRAKRYGPLNNLPCSCGEAFQDCSLWGPLECDLRLPSNQLPFERYSLIASRAITVAGDSERPILIVDSSKEPEALRRVIQFAQASSLVDSAVRVVVVYRDPRNWLVSDERNSNPFECPRSLRTRRRRLKKWSKRYELLRELVVTSGLQMELVRLRDLQMNLNPTLRSLFGWLAPHRDFSEITTLSNSRTHIAWGSHHRLQSAESGEIWQNYRLASPQIWLIPWLTSPGVWITHFRLTWWRWNRRWAPWDSNPRPTD